MENLTKQIYSNNGTKLGYCKTKSLIICFALILSFTINAQVGINTTNPKATLDIRSQNHNGALTVTDGILIPRVADLSVNGVENAQLVYLIADSGVNKKGFHYWNGLQWTPIDTTIEPWNKQATASPASLNTENIYTMGNVAIGLPYSTQSLHIHNTDSRDVLFTRLIDAASDDIDLDMVRGRGNNTTPAIAQNNDAIGGIRYRIINNIPALLTNDFYGASKPSAEVAAEVDGTVSTTSSPGRLLFKTTADGSTNALTRMVVKNDGKIGIGVLEPNSKLDVSGDIKTTSGSPVGNKGIVLFTDGAGLASIQGHPDSNGLIFSGTNNPVANPNLSLLNGKVGVNTATPETANLVVNGSVSHPIKTMSSGTVSSDDYTILVTGNVSLPTANASNLGRVYKLINQNTNSNVLMGIFSINGNTFNNYTLNNTDLARGIEVQSSGSAWIITNRF